MTAEITPDELAALLETDSPRIVDIRSPASFTQGHIPGSENVPFPQLPTSVEDLNDADYIVTVCPHGHDSLRAADIISSYEGISSETQVESLAGGLTAWDGELETTLTDNGKTGGEGPSAPF